MTRDLTIILLVLLFVSVIGGTGAEFGVVYGGGLFGLVIVVLIVLLIMGMI